MIFMKALIVVDMLNELIYGNDEQRLIDVSQRDRLVSNIKKIAELARKKSVPIIYSNLALRKSDQIIKLIGECCMKGSRGAEVIPELKPAKKDFVSEKKGYDGFFGSNLEKILKKLKVKEIYLAGTQTDCCVRETGVGAVHRGFKVSIIEDCCATNRPLGHEAALSFARGCIGDVIKSKDLKW